MTGKAGIQFNGIIYPFDEEKILDTEHPQCDACFLNKDFCETICLRVNKERNLRRGQKKD